jgi:type IV pilus assembly protein PilP
VGVIVGMALLMPFAGGRWQAWTDAHHLLTTMREQERSTQDLHAATAALQTQRAASTPRWGDASALTAPPSSPGLRLTQQSMALPKHTPSLTAMQLQQVAVQLQARGSWNAWMEWLRQWPQVAPGAALQSLLLEMDGDEVRADMAVWVTQPMLPAPPVQTSLVPFAQAVASGAGGPLDGTRWLAMQQQHAQQHVSYNLRVLPELRRPREPLEWFARARLHYVGQISKGPDVQALVRVGDAVPGQAHAGALAPIHRVRVGSHMGEHFGRISAITSDALWIQELVLAPGGEWVHRDIQLALQASAP